MRHPTSFANDCPSHDHHEYGPSTSGWWLRTTSTRVRGDTIEIIPVYEETAIRIELFGDEIEALYSLHPLTGEVIEKLDLAPAVVIGHSLGGATALDLAFSRPKLVRGLVLIDSAGLGAEVSGDLLDRIEAEPSREEAQKLLDLFFADASVAARLVPGLSSCLMDRTSCSPWSKKFVFSMGAMPNVPTRTTTAMRTLVRRRRVAKRRTGT